MTIANICIGHKRPEFEPNINYMMLCPQSLSMENETVISDSRFSKKAAGPSLAEYSQLFGLVELIQSMQVNAEHLFLFQYRKFIAPIIYGRESTASWVRILNSDEASLVFPRLNIEIYQSFDLIVGSVLDLNESQAQFYSRVHVIEDFALFTAACAESRLISDKELDDFCSMNKLIPSPALCYISVPLFLEVMTVLKKIAEIYIGRYFKKREGYQMRNSGYLLERLHSFLIFKYLRAERIKKFGLWNRFVIDPQLNIAEKNFPVKGQC